MKEIAAPETSLPGSLTGTVYNPQKGLVPGINLEVPNQEYHRDKTRLSSSDLKLVLKDPEAFYFEKIMGNRKEVENPAFDEGSYTHALILEPHKIPEDFVLFDGWRKSGFEYNQVKESALGKTIISKPQQHRCMEYLKAFEKRPEAVALIAGGYPEHTLCTDLMGVPIKVRTDYINVEEGIISDIKTTGYGAGVDIFKETVKSFSYDLSAALYCRVAQEIYGKPFKFNFIVISKADKICDVYRLSDASQAEGYTQVVNALTKYKNCLATGVWESATSSKPVKSNDFYEIEEV